MKHFNQHVSRLVLSLVAFSTLPSIAAAQPEASPSRQKQGTEQWVAPRRKARVKNPEPANEASIAAGKKLFEAGCIVCHGDGGRGDGPAASALQVKPTDLTTAVFGKQSDGEVFWKISTGRAPMPTFDAMYSATQRWQIVNYVKTLNPSNGATKKPVAPKAGHFLDAVVDDYLVVQALLAQENLKEATKALQKLSMSLDTLNLAKDQNFPKAYWQNWQSNKAKLQVSGIDLGKARTLQALRIAFGELSIRLEQSLKDFGYGGRGKVQLYSCKMAFEGKGAIWLQKKGMPANPYIGKKGADCSIALRLVEEVTPPQPTKRPPTPPKASH